MKKQIVVATLLAALMFAGTASANWGRGGGGFGGGNCPQGMGMMAPQLDEESRAKMVQFHKENQDLHKQMVMKQAEKRALMQQTQPDPQAAAKVAGELFDLRTALQQKAELAGVAELMGNCRQGMKHGRRGFAGRPCMAPMAGGQQGPPQP
jgi:Spy/CpxP family protein refolding chaperone